MNKVSNVKITKGADSITLSFTLPAGATGYDVEIFDAKLKHMPTPPLTWANAVRFIKSPEVNIDLVRSLHDDRIMPVAGEYVCRVRPTNGGVSFDVHDETFGLTTEDVLTYKFVNTTPTPPPPAKVDKPSITLVRVDKSGKVNPDGLSIQVRTNNVAHWKAMRIVGRIGAKCVCPAKEIRFADFNLSGVAQSPVSALLDEKGLEQITDAGDTIIFTVYATGQDDKVVETELKYELTQSQVDILKSAKKKAVIKNGLEGRVSTIEATLPSLVSKDMLAGFRASLNTEIDTRITTKVGELGKALGNEIGNNLAKALKEFGGRVDGSIGALTTSVESLKADVEKLKAAKPDKQVEKKEPEADKAKEPASSSPAPVQIVQKESSWWKIALVVFGCIVVLGMVVSIGYYVHTQHMAWLHKNPATTPPSPAPVVGAPQYTVPPPNVVNLHFSGDPASVLGAARKEVPSKEIPAKAPETKRKSQKQQPAEDVKKTSATKAPVNDAVYVGRVPALAQQRAYTAPAVQTQPVQREIVYVNQPTSYGYPYMPSIYFGGYAGYSVGWNSRSHRGYTHTTNVTNVYQAPYSRERVSVPHRPTYGHDMFTRWPGGTFQSPPVRHHGRPRS